jgi:hypothetical protein
MTKMISLLTHFQGKSAGFTMKPFESSPNKLVAARFQWQVCIGVLLQEAHVVATLHTPRQENNYTPRGTPLLRLSVTVTEPTNYTKLSKKIIHRADDLANLSPYNPVVREITTDFKPTYIPAKIVITLAVTITSYIKVRVTNTSEFKHSYYKPSSNKSSGSI